MAAYGFNIYRKVCKIQLFTDYIIMSVYSSAVLHSQISYKYNIYEEN